MQRSSSALVRPLASRPNKIAAGSAVAWAASCLAAVSASAPGHGMRRARALAPSTRAQSAIASSSESTTVAFATTSSACAARQSACGSGNRAGRTRWSDVNPIVFMARAAAPMLPGWLGSTSTMRTWSMAGAALGRLSAG